jgi:hypothetical protein
MCTADESCQAAQALHRSDRSLPPRICIHNQKRTSQQILHILHLGMLFDATGM